MTTTPNVSREPVRQAQGSPAITREERDLMVRWLRGFRRELLPCGLHAPVARKHEALLRRMRALDPRTLPSAPSPRAAAHSSPSTAHAA
jgi:hypothetical protein